MTKGAIILLGLIVTTVSAPKHAEAQGCAYKQEADVGWEPPAQGIVTDPRDAIKIAKIAWASINPRAKNIAEADWEKTMKAILTDRVWKVSRNQPTDTIGGDLIISISQCDGRVLDVLLTQ